MPTKPALTPEQLAKDFCEWWNIGALNDVETRKACREDAVHELTELLRAERRRLLERLPEKKNGSVKFPDTAEFRNGFNHGFNECLAAIRQMLGEK